MSKLLKKKNHKGSLQGTKAAPMQPLGKQPSTSLSNTKHQSVNNTKGGGSAMQGAKPHAKVMGASPTKHGQYL